LEHFTDASFLGKVLLLPANVRPGLTATSILAYLASSSVTKEKSFIILTPVVNGIKLFSLSLLNKQNKLEFLFLATHSSLWPLL